MSNFKYQIAKRKKFSFSNFIGLSGNKNIPKNSRGWQAGFTIVEYLLVIGVFAILIGLVTLNLGNAKQKASLSTTVDSLVSDLHEQQLKAMVGDTEGSGNTSASDYGIYFGTTSYTLFRGTYGTGNFVINLGDKIQVATPGSQIIFSKGSGETGSTFQVMLRDTSNSNQKTVTINRLGVVTGIN